MKKSIIFALLITVCFSGIVHAGKAQANTAEVSFARFATQEEVIGYWDLVQWPEDMKRKQKVNPWPATPYQYFVFYDDGHLFYKMSTEESLTTPKELDALYAMFPPTITYEMKNGFMLVRHSNLPGYGELWGVNIITKRIVIGTIEHLPGDLVMSLDDGKGQVVYYRHLRRMNN